jgi:uncharacterized protein YdeI (YjbR/CyaY-like superfamily)
VSPALNHLPLVEPGGQAEWRTWLEAHGATSPGIWLAIGKKGNARTSLTYEQAVEEALCFGWIDSTVNRLDGDRFKQLFTPRKPNSTWSRSNKVRVERLIAEERMTPAGLAVIEIARANGSWNSLDDVEALVVPDDLEAALTAWPEAAERFAATADSQRKMVLYWISSAKRTETRERRIAKTVASAAEGKLPF